MDMYSKLLIGQRTYPFDVLIFSMGSALTAAHFCQTAVRVKVPVALVFLTATVWP